MNSPSPLVPQGSNLEQKNRSRSRVKVAFFCVVGVHVAVMLVALLAQGCKREQPVPQPDMVEPVTEMDTNVVAPDTNAAPNYEPTPAPAVVETPAPATPTVNEYVIQKGDTFYGIAKKFGVSMKAIQDANPSVQPTKLKPGQKIVIPSAAAAPAGVATPTLSETGEQTYVVKSGDTLSSIATKFHSTVKALRAANNLTTDKIYVGHKLKIPAKAEAPAPVPVPETMPAPAAPAAPAPAPSALPPAQ
jgi:LysM repeat protein